MAHLLYAILMSVLWVGVLSTAAARSAKRQGCRPLEALLQSETWSRERILGVRARRWIEVMVLALVLGWVALFLLFEL